MAKLSLSTILSGFQTVAQLNQNFTDIESEFQNKVLYRDNPSGEPNSMQNDLDMNSNDILNVGNINAEVFTLSNAALGPDTYVFTNPTGFTAELLDDPDAFIATGTLKSGYVVANKTEAAALSLTSSDAGRKIFVASDDGGEFTVEYNVTPSTYADDGGSYCGTVFIPSGGDGTIGIVRDSVFITLEMYGASGDGATDDTAEIQAALSSANGVIYGTYGKTYLVSFTGTKSIVSVNNNYCLLIPNGTTLDLRGATVKLADSQNSALFMNENAGSYSDTDVGLTNGIIDGNQANQTTPAAGDMPCIFFWGINRVRVENIRAINVRQYAGRFLNIDRGNFVNLSCSDSDGDGWSFGVSASSQTVRYSHIDNIRSENCLQGYGSLQGNPAIFTIQHCTIGTVTSKDCAGGIKIQDDSKDSTVSRLVYDGTNNGTANSGIKVQGNSGAGVFPSRISIGDVSSQNAYGEGLYIIDSYDVSVASFVSDGDDTGGSGRAAMIEGTRTQIGRISVNSPGTVGVLIRTAAADYNIGSIIVNNPTGDAVQITSTGYGDIGNIQATDDQGTPTTDYVLKVTSATAKGRCGHVRTNLANDTAQPRAFIAATNYSYTIGKITLGDVDSGGNITLTNTATSTTVSNGSVFRVYVGGGSNDYLHPVINVIPMDATSDALTALRAGAVTDYSSGTGFSISHSTAGADDDVYWYVDHWKVIPSSGISS